LAGQPKLGADVRSLGQRVWALRRARKWTLDQTAEASDNDLKHWQKVEAGQINVTLVTLVRIADGLGEPIASLFKR
jgi:transcriptional regulator with XRE-family HTH domain